MREMRDGRVVGARGEAPHRARFAVRVFERVGYGLASRYLLNWIANANSRSRLILEKVMKAVLVDSYDRIENIGIKDVAKPNYRLGWFEFASKQQPSASWMV